MGLDFHFLWRRKLSALAVGLLFSIGGTAFFVHGAMELDHAYRLGGAAEMAPGKVLNLFTSHGRRSTSYHVAYSYVVGNEEVTNQNLPIPRAEYLFLSTGDTISVRYLRDEATISEPNIPGEAGYAIWNAWFVTLFPLLFAAGGFYSAFFSPQGEDTGFGSYQSD